MGGEKNEKGDKKLLDNNLNPHPFDIVPKMALLVNKSGVVQPWRKAQVTRCSMMMHASRRG